jgi:hypothetical protein
MDGTGVPDSASIALDGETQGVTLTFSALLSEPVLRALLIGCSRTVQELYMDCRALTFNTVACLAENCEPRLRVLHVGRFAPEVNSATVTLLKGVCLPGCDVRIAGPVSESVKEQFAGFAVFE